MYTNLLLFTSKPQDGAAAGPVGSAGPAQPGDGRDGRSAQSVKQCGKPNEPSANHQWVLCLHPQKLCLYIYIYGIGKPHFIDIVVENEYNELVQNVLYYTHFCGRSLPP